MYAVVRDGEFSTKCRERRTPGRRPTRRATCCARSPKPPGSAAIPACSTTPPSIAGTPRRTRRASTPAIPAANTCSSTTPPATWPVLNLLKFAPQRHIRRRSLPPRRRRASSPRRKSWSTTPAIRPRSIARNSHDYRPLGLGYANLGALLMAAGLPYDSDAGRDYAACVTAIMCGEAYLQSSRIAEQCPPLDAGNHATSHAARSSITGGACPGWYINREPFLDVIRMHRASREQHQQEQRARQRSTKPAKPVLGRSSGPRREARLSQRAGHRARAHRHHRLHDGLRHHRHRARPRAGEVQEAGRRRHDQDRQQHRARGAVQAGLHHDQADAIVSYIDATGTIEGAPACQRRAPRRVRLLLQAGEGHALHPLHGPPAHDGGRAAVHLRRDLQDRQPARRTPRWKTSWRPTSRPGSWA